MAPPPYPVTPVSENLKRLVESVTYVDQPTDEAEILAATAYDPGDEDDPNYVEPE